MNDLPLQNTIINTIGLCQNFYKPETFQHCLRVGRYVYENVCLESEEDKILGFCIGLCHDLIEDTKVTAEDICDAIRIPTLEWIEDVMLALSQQEGESYLDYIKRLKECPDKIAYVVKLADMKDHLTQTDTLTDKLKEKYWKALPELL